MALRDAMERKLTTKILHKLRVTKRIIRTQLPGNSAAKGVFL
jgi:hypothetical protein